MIIIGRTSGHIFRPITKKKIRLLLYFAQFKIINTKFVANGSSFLRISILHLQSFRDTYLGI